MSALCCLLWGSAPPLAMHTVMQDIGQSEQALFIVQRHRKWIFRVPKDVVGRRQTFSIRSRERNTKPLCITRQDDDDCNEKGQRSCATRKECEQQLLIAIGQ